MTKNEIIRELSRCNPCRIRSLFVVYHNSATCVRYSFSYENDPSLGLVPLATQRELAKVVLSAYKLRKYIKVISVSYFSSANGESCIRYYSDYCLVPTISDFIKSIKK